MFHRTALSLALALVVGCRTTIEETGNPPDTDTDTPLETDTPDPDTDPGELDEDNDGVPAREDCDDDDATVNPGAAEVCDGKDNDCNGQIDDDATDATPFYADADNDGHGNAALTITACAAPAQFIATSGDCNDANADIYPGAPEEDCEDPIDYNCDGSVGFADADGDGFAACTDCDDTAAAINPAALERCDNVDNDCDGDTDEQDAIDAPTWYADADNDTYGDAAVSQRGCAAPTGHVANRDDCDDAEGAVHPGAPETCNDRDDNCNGLIDEGATDAQTWFADADGDGFGGTSLSQVACDPPPGHVANNDDCDDLSAASKPGALEQCDGKDNDCDGVLPAEEADNDNDGLAACAGDCDDDNAAVRPGQPERCNGIDDNCSGTIDGPEAVDPPSWYLDQDADGYGSAVTITACAQPSGWAAEPGDCDDTKPSFNPGVTPGCDGKDYDCDGEVDNDADADGFPDSACGGTDCDDNNAAIFPEQGGTLCAMGASCADILEVGLDDGDGVYTLDPDGYANGAPPFEAWCDMSFDGGGWTLLLKATAAPTLSYGSALWTNTALLNPTPINVEPGDAKYLSFVTLPVSSLRGCFPTQDVCFFKDFTAPAAANAIFAAGNNEVIGHDDQFPDVWSRQPNCQRFGVNVNLGGRQVRFGFTANQENNCDSNDTSAGFGLHSAYGAGALCTSSVCTNVAQGGGSVNTNEGFPGLLWGR